MLGVFRDDLESCVMIEEQGALLDACRQKSEALNKRGGRFGAHAKSHDMASSTFGKYNVLSW